MCISISYSAGILVAVVWFLPGWVRCYELLYVHMRYLPFSGAASWVQWNCRRDAVIMWRIAVLSCTWSFRLCRGRCVSGTVAFVRS
jgi:hypothetical protein